MTEATEERQTSKQLKMTAWPSPINCQVSKSYIWKEYRILCLVSDCKWHFQKSKLSWLEVENKQAILLSLWQFLEKVKRLQTM